MSSRIRRVPTLLLFACALVPASARAQSAASSVDDMRLVPGDVVRVDVRDEPGMGGQFQVDEDGWILIPVLGLVRVAERPFSEVRDEVRALYARELADPVLRVTPLVRVAVLGEVMRPGLFPVDPTHSVWDVLATVGGLTPLADRGEVLLVRGGESTRIRIEPGSATLALPLRSGDRLLIGRRSWFSEHLAIFVGAAASVAAAAVTTLIVR